MGLKKLLHDEQSPEGNDHSANWSVTMAGTIDGLTL
jgi:hypothetical protein